MKKLIAISLIIMFGIITVPVVSANTESQIKVVVGDQDRQRMRDRRSRANRKVVVRMEQRYIRIGRRVYREVYRSTYTRRGRLLRRQLIRRERLSRYDRYNDRDFRRDGIRLGIHINF